MRSTYLEHMEEELLTQMREEQAETAYAYDYKITSLNRDRPEKGSLLRDALPGGIAGIAGLAISAPVAIGLGLSGMAAKHLSSSMGKQGKNADIDTQIQQVEQMKAAACKAVEDKYRAMIQKEKDRFLTVTKNSRVRFAQSAAAATAMKWLAVRFEAAIRQADRSPGVKFIQTDFAFGVREYGVEALRWDGSRYAVVELYEFSPNGLPSLPEFDDQVGFSQAVSRLLRFEIASRFPQDPIAPSALRPRIFVGSDDDIAELTYQVPNPKC